MVTAQAFGFLPLPAGGGSRYPPYSPISLSPLLPPMSDLSPAWEARGLLRAARVGTLASVADGQPFASLVTPACAPDLSLLLLLSDLSEHTRHLRAEPRCSVLVAGPPVGANPQTAPRVTRHRSGRTDRR